jgi:hypothetical protein
MRMIINVNNILTHFKIGILKADEKVFMRLGFIMGEVGSN